MVIVLSTGEPFISAGDQVDLSKCFNTWSSKMGRVVVCVFFAFLTKPSFPIVSLTVIDPAARWPKSVSTNSNSSLSISGFFVSACEVSPRFDVEGCFAGLSSKPTSGFPANVGLFFKLSSLVGSGCETCHDNSTWRFWKPNGVGIFVGSKKPTKKWMRAEMTK